MYAKMFINRSEDARGAERRDANTGATLRADRAEPIDVTVLNLSTTGVAIGTSHRIAIGATISIGIPGVQARSATVVRETAEGYGCEFEQPISSEEVAIAGIDTLILLPGGSIDADAFPEPHVVPWPPRTRLIVGVAAAAGLWGAVYALGRLLF